MQLPKGEWLLRRPLTLPVSTRSVFLSGRIIISRLGYPFCGVSFDTASVKTALAVFTVYGT